MLCGSLSCVGLREVEPDQAAAPKNDQVLGFKKWFPVSTVSEATGFEVTNNFFVELGQAASKLRSAYQLTRAECPTVELRLILKAGTAQANCFANHMPDPSANIMFWCEKGSPSSDTSSLSCANAAAVPDSRFVRTDDYARQILEPRMMSCESKIYSLISAQQFIEQFEKTMLEPQFDIPMARVFGTAFEHYSSLVILTSRTRNKLSYNTILK